MMNSRFLLGGLLAASAVGCQMYGPYGQPYYGSYPGAYPQGGTMSAPAYPPGTMPPAGVAPGATYPPGATYNGTMGPAQPGYGPSSGYSPNYQQGADISGSSYGPAQTFPNSTNTTSPRPPGHIGGPEKLVPNYNDPSGVPAGTQHRAPVATPSINDEANFKDGINGPNRAGAALKGLEQEPIQKTGATQIDTTIPEDPFAPPKNFTPTNFEMTAVERSAQKPDATRPNPYAHDFESHTWFRGVVDYDEQDQAWYLVYNPTPPEEDTFGGTITLLEDPSLTRLQPDDVVLVEGSFDPAHTDRYGNPKYRLVKRAERLVPNE